MDIKTEFSSTEFEDCIKKEEFFEKFEENDDDSSWYDGESCLDSQSKKIAKKRKKYQKIDNETRLKIVEEVQKNGKLLKNAAEKYNVNYSSAKSIFHVYRKEGRILKKPLKGRTSKTILHLNNPIVFVNIPGPMSTPTFNNTNKINQDTTQNLYPQVWQQVSSFNPMMLSSQVNNKEAAQGYMVSIMQQNSASFLQNFQNPAFMGPTMYTNVPVNSCMISQNGYRNSMIDKSLDSPAKIGKTATSAANNVYSSMMRQKYQFVDSPQSMERGSYGQESYKRAMAFNHWVQSNPDYLKSSSLNY